MGLLGGLEQPGGPLQDHRHEPLGHAAVQRQQHQQQHAVVNDSMELLGLRQLQQQRMRQQQQLLRQKQHNQQDNIR